MRVIILDNGLRSTGEHSYAISVALTRHLSELGVPYTIYAFSGVEDEIKKELGCIPHFSRSLYDNIWPAFWKVLFHKTATSLKLTSDDLHPSECRTSRSFNAAFESDLRRLPDDVWDASNIVLLPGLMQHQVLGLGRFLASNAAKIHAKIICQLMFEPDWLPWPRKGLLAKQTYQAAFDLTRDLIGKQLFFAAENRHIKDTYFDAFGVPVSILPIPLLAAAGPARSRDVIRLGFFGYSKADKGFNLLPEAIGLCSQARSDLEFTVQIQHHGYEIQVVRAEAALRRLANVRILDGSLSAQVYAAETTNIDIMLLPYDPVMFGLRGSGIFIESVTAGRLIVASEGIWAAISIGCGEAAGEVFSPYTSAALAAAILRLCSDWPLRQSEAAEKAAAFQRSNSIVTYVERLIALTA